MAAGLSNRRLWRAVRGAGAGLRPLCSGRPESRPDGGGRRADGGMRSGGRPGRRRRADAPGRLSHPLSHRRRRLCAAAREDRGRGALGRGARRYPRHFSPCGGRPAGLAGRLPADRDRISRHYHDAAMIAATATGEAALADTALLDAVRNHSLIAFRQAWKRFGGSRSGIAPAGPATRTAHGRGAGLPGHARHDPGRRAGVRMDRGPVATCGGRGEPALIPERLPPNPTDPCAAPPVPCRAPVRSPCRACQAVPGPESRGRSPAP